ncbi:benenodin family lasso peptide [Sphingobium olei]|uniref:Benenodin family lasso peptide n=1 Tax=Sphingobium olei TaxID=420955 RepID=A0ABW3NYM4_9SPHN
MEREHELSNDLIDLGAVTEETKGGMFGREDGLDTQQIGGGLTDD